MNKYVAIGVLLLVALGLIVFTTTIVTNAPAEEESEMSVGEFTDSSQYSCAESKSFFARFNDGVAEVTVDGEAYTLEEDGNGVYKNDTGFVFATQDYGGYIEQNGERTHTDCVVLTPNGNASRSGNVVAVNSDEIAFDGPYRITIEDGAGMRSEIAVPSMGLPVCAAYQSGDIIDPSTITIGQALEVAGTLGEDGTIVPCEEGHYLR